VTKTPCLSAMNHFKVMPRRPHKRFRDTFGSVTVDAARGH